VSTEKKGRGAPKTPKEPQRTVGAALNPTKPEASYTVELVIVGLPKTPNQLLGAHWRVRSNNAAKWKGLVAEAIKQAGGAPTEPLPFARIHCTRVSSGKMDDDNLRGSFKSVIDGLKACGVIQDDSKEHVEVTYTQERGPSGHGKIKVRVEALRIAKNQTHIVESEGV
jgi:hypothetical protein